MAKLCENCGKKNNFLIGNPFSLDDDRMLCCKCAESITNELFNLDNAKTQEDVALSRKKMLDICHSQFGSDVAQLVIKRTETKYSQKEKQFSSVQTKKADLQEIQHMISNHMLTSGYTFDGYFITKYIGIISGQVVLGTGFLSELTASFSDFFGEESNAFSAKLEKAKEAAMAKMVKKSIENGGNAIIGVDFDYIIFHNNMIGVVANGTSVVIEQNYTCPTHVEI